MFREKTARDRIRKINKEIKLLKKQFKKTEIRPCQNDSELLKKEKDLGEILARISTLEKERDSCILEANRKSPK